MTVCLSNRQRAKLFVEYSSTRRKKERKSGERRELNTGQNGRRDGREDVEPVTHDAMGKRTD